MNITGPKEVGSLWPLHGDEKQILEGIITKINDRLSECDPTSKAYGGLIDVEIPTSCILAHSISIITATFIMKAREKKWRVAELNLFEYYGPPKTTKATFEFLLGR